MEYRIPRIKNTDLILEGTILCDLSSKSHDAQAHWSEVRIYKTDSGKWVTESVGRSIVPGERDKRRVKIHASVDTVRSGISRNDRNGVFITTIGLQALREAANKDPELLPTLEERI